MACCTAHKRVIHHSAKQGKILGDPGQSWAIPADPCRKPDLGESRIVFNHHGRAERGACVRACNLRILCKVMTTALLA
jgi:hypothetical protein